MSVQVNRVPSIYLIDQRLLPVSVKFVALVDCPVLKV